MKKVILSLITVMFCISMCGCDYAKQNDCSFLIYEHTTLYTIYQHKETGVCYFYTTGSITPMFNDDGTLYIVE